MSTDNSSKNQNFVGLVGHFTVEGVDFRASFRGSDGQRVPGSVMLNVSHMQDVKKVVNGEEIVSKSKRFAVLPIETPDDLIKSEVDKFASLMNQKVDLQLEIPQGAKFKIIS